MAVLSRRNFNTIEILRVDSDPNGTSAITGSLAKVVGSGVVWKNVGGTSWEVLNSGALAPLSGPAGSPVGSSYVVLGSDGTLTSERVLTAGSGISLTDGGAGGSLTIAATGGSELIESKYIADNTQTVSFTGLDGDADKFYYLIIKAVTSTAHSMYLNFNNSSSNLSAIVHATSVSLANAVTHTSAYYNTTIPIFGSSYTDYQYFATISIDAKSGANRYSFMNLLGSNPANFKIINNQASGKWANTSDNLTSIDLVGTVSNSLLSGSSLHLYRGSVAL